MKLIKTSLFSGIITVIRITSGFVVLKFIAFFTGPAGVALIGGFQNFISIVLSFGNGAINNGVVKYTAEYQDNEKNTKKLFSTSFKITTLFSLTIGILLLIFGSILSKLIFGNLIYSFPIRILGITLFLYTLNILFVNILNGKGLIKKYSIVNISGSLVGLIFTIISVYFFKIQGALISLVLSQSIVFFITCSILWKNDWFSKKYFFEKFDKKMALKLGNYSLMAITTAITVPVAQILIRNHITNTITIEKAGHWQALLKISDAYLMLITTSLTTYYLPKLSSLKQTNEIKKEVLNGYKIILPVVIISSLIIYILREWIIKLLYSDAFLEMENLFFWQFLGDIIKISSWILAYNLVAKAHTKLFIITEIFFNLLYVALVYYLIPIYNIKGVTIAYTVNYSIYLIVMIFIFKKLILKTNYE